MAIDLHQFSELFFEESKEGLDVIENGLLNLSVEETDVEQLHHIFRAAHSIKGGAGTFGFTAISEFTHEAETLLDLMREGVVSVSQPRINALLQAVDVMRVLFTAAADGSEIDAQQVAQVQQHLEDLCDSEIAPADSTQPEPATADKSAETPGATDSSDPLEANTNQSGWQIEFLPHADLFRTGNDPVRILRELAALGEISVELTRSTLPEFGFLEPEDCYLGWRIQLLGDIDRSDLEEVFDWVTESCDLSLEPLDAVQEQVVVTPGSAVTDDGSVEEGADLTEAPVCGQTMSAEDPVEPAAQPTVAGQRVSSTAKQNAPDEVTETDNPPNKAAEQKRSSSPASENNGSIRVATDKVDALINMVGELVITQSMLGQLADELDLAHAEKFAEGLSHLERNTRELQENVMRIRMMPISFVFNRFPRLVHDLCGKLGKKINLVTSGEHTELDKTVMEKIGDPLVHLVRNALDHGIETPDVRELAGKPPTGTLSLSAQQQGGNIVIEISDDGAGLDREKILSKAINQGLLPEGEFLSDEKVYELILQPGFSTAEQVSDLSGRGVGMDVVQRNIAELGGSLEVQSQLGRGTTMTVRLPLTLAIVDGQSVVAGGEVFITPLVAVVESIQVAADQVRQVATGQTVFKLRGEYLPLVRLHDLFDLAGHRKNVEDGIVVVVEAHGKRVGLFVDDLLGQQQVVIKSLETNYGRVPGISGATILGDGTVALILDVAGLITLTPDKLTSNRKDIAPSADPLQPGQSGLAA